MRRRRGGDGWRGVLGSATTRVAVVALAGVFLLAPGAGAQEGEDLGTPCEEACYEREQACYDGCDDDACEAACAEAAEACLDACE